MTDLFDFSRSEGRIRVFLCGRLVGKDLHVAIFGGDWPHIGAVAVSYSHPSLKDPQRSDVTTSVMTVPGHKEDLLVREAARRIASATGLTTSVSCGIHVERISEAEIRTVQRLVEQLTTDLVDRISPVGQL